MTAHMLSLGEILEISGSKRAGDRQLPIMSITMHDGLIDQADRFKKRIASQETSNYKVVGLNELVVGFPIDEGVLGFQRKYEAAAVSPAYDVWRVRDAKQVDLDYLEKYLRSPQAIHAYRTRMRGAVSRRRVLTKEDFRMIEVPFPSVLEQRRIAAILDKADALLTKRREAIAKLDQLLQSVFLDMFGDPVMNPKNWPLVAVDNLCALVRGSSPRPQGDPRFFGGSVPRLMVADVTRDGWFVTPKIDSLTLDGAKKSRPTKAGTVVMAVSGNVGLASILAVDACIHDGFVGFSDLDEERILPVNLLMNLHFLKQTHRNITAGAIFQNLTTTDIKKLALPVPPLNQQKEFLRRFSAIRAWRDALETSASYSQKLSCSLQERVFSGKLRLQA